MKEVLIPATGFAMTEALLVRWYKQPGDPVTAGEAIAEIETDKATVDLESPCAGILGPHLAIEGTSVPVGVPLTHIVEDGDPAVLEVAREEPAAAVVPMLSATVDENGRSEPVARDTPAQSAVIADPGRNGRRDPHRLSPRQRAKARLAAEADVESGRQTDPGPAEVPETGRGGNGSSMPGPWGDPTTSGGPATDELLEWLEAMMLIREFESRLDPLALAGKIPGGVHLSIGQEAVAVGVIRALRPNDLVAGTHRSHHHALALGIEPGRIMAELLGKASGTNGGRGGSMHVADRSRGFIGGNGIVGAGVGLAMGAALAAAYNQRDQVVVGFVGDGGVNTGRTWEAANMAAIWDLPLIIVCENNLYAVETATASVTAATSIVERAAAFGLHAVVVDGQDVSIVHAAVSEARARAIAGGGPTFIEARTYRYEGHSTGQIVRYRTAEEVNEWRTTRDPIERVRASLMTAGLADDTALAAMADRVRGLVDEAVRFAESAAWPDVGSAADGVTALALNVRTNP